MDEISQQLNREDAFVSGAQHELKRRSVVICISGPSGVGKGTVIAALRERLPGLRLSVSATTRQPRPGEEEGVAYYFRRREDFEAMIQEGRILEYDEFCGNYYGTLREELETAQEHGEDIVLDVTVKGALAVKENYPGAKTVFLLPPSMEHLAQRLSNRGTESPEVRSRRLAEGREEMTHSLFFDYILINETVEESAEQLHAILVAEKQRRRNCIGFEDYLKSM